MLHLFNKIYVKGDHLVKGSRDAIIISPTYGNVPFYTTKFSTRANNEKTGQLCYSATSLKELLDTHFGGSDAKFFNYLMKWPAEKRLTIYADLPTMVDIATRFFKTVFPKMTEDTYVVVMKLLLSRINYYLGGAVLPFVTLTEDQANSYRVETLQILEDVGGLRHRFQETARWRLTKVARDSIIRNCSVEYQLATYLTNPKWAHARAFEKKAVSMAKKQIIHEYALEIKGAIVRNFMNLIVLEPTATFNSLKDSLETFVQQFPQYAFVLDDGFVPDNAEHIWLKYNMEDLKTVFDRVTHKFVFIAQDYTPLLKKLTFEDVLKYELDRPYRCFLFNGDNYQETVNSYLIDYILNAYRMNQHEQIRQLAL